MIANLDDNHSLERNLVQIVFIFLYFCLVFFIWQNNNFSFSTSVNNLDNSTFYFADNSRYLWNSSFKNFLNTGKTLSNISTNRRCTSGVEGSHRQLSSWFTNSLGSDCSHCFSKIYQFVASQIQSVTFLTNTSCRLTRHRRAYYHFLYSCIFHCSCIVSSNKMIFLKQNISVFVFCFLCQISTLNTLFKRNIKSNRVGFFD